MQFNAMDYLNANDDLDEIKNAAMRASSLAARPRRAGGGSALSKYAMPSDASAKATAYIGENSADPRYVGENQPDVSANAYDDGTHAPQAAASYLDGIHSDPEWQSLDKEHSNLIGDMGSTGYAINDWLSHGRTGSTSANKIQEIALRKREIEQRYKDKAIYDAAQQEKFDYRAPIREWNREKGSYENVTYGSHGTRKVMGETTGDVKEMTTSAGEKVFREIKPGGSPMEEDKKVGRLPSTSKYLGLGYTGTDEPTESAPPQYGPFAGGIAAAEPAMQKIGETPEEQAKKVAEIARGKSYDAETRLRDAQTENARYQPVSAGGSLFDTKDRRGVYTAPDHAGRYGLGGIDRSSPTGSAMLGAVRSVYLDLKKSQEAAQYLNPNMEVKSPQQLWQDAQEVVKLEDGASEEEAGLDFLRFGKYTAGKPRGPVSALPNPNAAGGGFGDQSFNPGNATGPQRIKLKFDGSGKLVPR
jgi:hypothetical protein